MRRYVLAALLIAATALAAGGGAAALLQVTSARLTTQTFTDVVGTATLRPNQDRDTSIDNDWNNESGNRCNSAPSGSPVQCYLSLRDSNDATYITTGNNPSNRKAEFELDNAPIDVPATGSPVVLVKVSFRAQKAGNGNRTLTATVELKSGTTTIASASSTNVPASFTTITGSDTSVSLTRTQVDNLYVVVTANTAGGGSGNNQLRVSEIWVDITYLK
jgi:hypothetical protein